MSILIVNSLFYWLSFFHYYRKDGFTLMVFLWFYYAVFSTFGVVLMQDGLYFKVMGINPNRADEISIIPYLLLYFSFWVVTYPLRPIRLERFYIAPNAYRIRFVRKFKRFCYGMVTAYLLLKFYQIYLIAHIGFGYVHDMGGEATNAFLYSGPVGFVCRIVNLSGSFVVKVFMPFVMFFVLYGYFKHWIEQKEVIRCSFLYMCGALAVGVVGGSRAQMFFAIMQLLFFFVLFREKISRKLKRLIYITGGVVGGLIVLVTSIITEQRFENEVSMTPGESILRYLGEMWPNLGYEYWGRVHSHPGFISSENTENMDGSYWIHESGIHVWWFKTFFGDLYLWYGTAGALLVILLCAFLARTYMHRKVFKLHTVGFVFFAYQLCETSLFNFVITSPTNLTVLALMVVFSRFIKKYISKPYTKLLNE